MKRRSLATAVAGVAVLSLALTACGSKKGDEATTSSSSGSAAGSGNIVNGGYTTKGGTVNILSDAGFEHLDPVQNYVSNSLEIGRLIYRTLTMAKDEAGTKPTVAPDLAEGLGVSSNGGKTWTYKIKSGLKYEDGETITTKDIKYNVERSFATDIYKDGATYMADLLDNTNDYAGPYDGSGKDLTAVQTPDDQTIVFNFKAPQADADWIVSLPYTSPVPQAKDTKQDYDNKPLSSGPYKITSYTPNVSLTLERNDQWSQSSDELRTALPDKFVETFGIDLPTISSRLIADQGDDQTAVTLENSGALQNSDIPKLQQASVKSRFVNGPTPYVDYIWMNETKITDPDVRKAIALAINRSAIQVQYGGDQFGKISNTIISEQLEGYNPPTNLGLKDSGDVDAAKQLLQGKTVPELHYGVASTSVKQKAVAQQVQNDLKAVGINLVIDQIDGASYYKTIRSDAAPDMGRAGWGWDWPTSASVVPPLFGPDSTGTTWNSNNFSRYFDSTESAKISALANSDDTPANIGKDFNDLANQIQSTNWPLLPTIALLQPNVVGSKIQNAGVSPAFGQIDLTRIGVKS